MNKTLIGIFAGLAFVLTASVAHATPMVVPPGSTVAGNTIGEWTAEWWKWVAGQSVPNDALSDTTGANADVNQAGPVWFLGGTFGETVTRSFSVPHDTYLLLPMVNLINFDETNTESEADLRAGAAGLIALVDNLFVEIDGVPVPDLFDYQELSPFFQIVGAPDNPLGAPATPSNAVSDGYWLMLEPFMEEGSHTVRFGGGISEFNFAVDITDNLTVPEPPMVALLGIGIVVVGFARRRSNRAQRVA